MSVLAVSVWCRDAQILPSKSQNFGALDTDKKKFTLYHLASLIFNGFYVKRPGFKQSFVKCPGFVVFVK